MGLRDIVYNEIRKARCCSCGKLLKKNSFVVKQYKSYCHRCWSKNKDEIEKF